MLLFPFSKRYAHRSCILSRAVLVSILLFGSISLAQNRPRFSFEKPDIDVNGSPWAMAVADFNKDGIPDLALSSGEILLGSGDGTFRHAPTLSSGGWVVTADFNGDSIPDLAFVVWGKLTVFFGNGDGTFRLAAEIPASMDAWDLVTADFNHDGIPDLATLSPESGTVSIFLGKGDGTFSEHDVAIGLRPNSLITGDFNGDGIPDLAAAYCCDGDFGSGGKIYILFGNGDGTFQAASPVPAFGPRHIASGDLNGDGLTDIVVSEAGCHTPCYDVFLLLSNGDGSFRYLSVSGLDGAPGKALIGDFNSDGLPDIAIGYSANGANGVAIALGRGDGTFSAIIHSPAGYAPLILTSADFNGDGIADLVTGNSNGSLTMLLGLGDGSFESRHRYPLTQTCCWSFAAADFNGDGVPDIALVDQRGSLSYSNSLFLLIGNGHGTFQTAQDTGVDPKGSMSLITADFNGDGIPDLAVGNILVAHRGVYILLGNGDGSFREPITADASLFAQHLVAADFNGDGIPDLAVATSSRLVILLGNGDGTFQPGIEASAGGFAGQLVAADFNQDGKADLAIVNSTRSIAVLLGNGDGTFQPPLNIQVPEGPFALATGDFNEDGIPDLAVAGSQSPTSVLVGNGDGTFSLGYTSSEHANGILAADFDADGHQDLALLVDANAVLILAGNGHGSFQQPSRFAAAGMVLGWNFSVGDWNRDGLPDLAVLSSEYTPMPSVSILLNKSRVKH